MERERVERERDSEVFDEEEVQRETRRLARWRRPEGFGERRQRRETQERERRARCCGRWLKVVRRGAESRRIGSDAEFGLEELRQARHDILNN